MEREIPSELSTDNRGEWDIVFSCDPRFDTLSFPNPVKRSFWMVFFDAFCEVDERKDMSACTATDQKYFFVLHGAILRIIGKTVRKKE